MGDVKSDEYRFLRQEHEANRKLVFERPLLIVAATLAAAFSTAERGSLGLSLPFLSLLAFNLWFTHNRLESSARIVAYLQLIHEGEAKFPWLGWERSLRHYRKWLFKVRSGEAQQPAAGDIPQFDSMAFYGPIFYFHLLLGVVVTAVLLARSEALARVVAGTQGGADVASLIGLGGALALFGAAVYRFRPRPVRHMVEKKRQVWIAVFQSLGAGSTQPPGDTESESPAQQPSQPASGSA
jgi:hypothetical protein